MDSVIERLATIPKMVGGFLTTAVGATVVNTEPMHGAIEASQQGFLWTPFLVTTATVLAGLGTFSLCVLRWVVEYRKAKKEKVFE